MLAAASLLTLHGCAVGPDFTKPDISAPPKWDAQGEPPVTVPTAVDTLWWKEFKDPALDRLIELAYQQNLPLQIAGLRIMQARAQLAIAVGRQYPQTQALFGSVMALGMTQQFADFSGLGRNFVTYQVGFDASWEIDFFGKYRRAVEAESDNTEAAIADYYSTLVSLTAEVARSYVVIRTFDVLIAQAQSNAKIQEEGLKIAESRFHNGATSELDPTQATTLLDSTLASIPELRAGLAQSRNALSTLLGQPTGALDAVLGTPGDIPNAPQTVFVGVPTEMLRRRPDIRSAEFQAAAQCARIGVAKSELYPSFTLAGSIGLQAFSSGQTSHNLFSSDAFVYSIGPQVTWPVLNYGRLINNVRVQDALFQQLLVSYRNTVITAFQEVEDAMIGYRNARDAQALEEGSVKAAQRAVEIAFSQYREGAVDFQRVLDAQRSLLREQDTLAQMRSSVATNLIALYKALGGGWEMHRTQPVVPAATQEEMKKRTHWGDLLAQPPEPEAAKSAPPAKQ